MTPPVRARSSGEGRFAQEPASQARGAQELPAPTPSDRARFSDALRALGRQIDTGERLVERALSPGAARLGAADLIALQAGIYRYSEAVDLAAKLIDRAGFAVRTTLQGGGQ